MSGKDTKRWRRIASIRSTIKQINVIAIQTIKQRNIYQKTKNGKWTNAGFSLKYWKEVRTRVKYMGIYGYKKKYTISEMCRFFDISQSGYYKYISRMDILAKDLPLTWKIQERQEKCVKAYEHCKVYIWLEKWGIHHGPKTILRVVQKYNLLFVRHCISWKFLLYS